MGGEEDSCQKQKKLLKNSSFYIVIKVEQIPICRCNIEACLIISVLAF